MSNSPGGQFYSSSQVISYSSDGSGQPKYYQASTETTHGPDGVSSLVVILMSDYAILVLRFFLFYRYKATL